MAKKNIAYVAASAAVSCAVFAYLFTVVRPAEIAEAIRNASIAGICVYAGLSLLTTILRNWRYLVLVRAVEKDVPISGWQMFLVTLVRNLFSDLLPARVGSLIYIYILKARFGIGVDIGTSTYSIAFILDFVVMVPLMCVGVAVVGAERLGIAPAVLFLIAALFFALTVVVLLSLPRILPWAGRVVERLFRARGKAVLVRETLDRTGVQIRAIYGTGSFWKASVLSFMIRALKYGCIAFLVYAVLNPIDPERYTLRSIGYWPVFVGASLAELSASTPVSGIAGFGAYEGVWQSAFQLLGYPQKLAALSGIAAHIITQAFGYSLGAIAIVVLTAPLLSRRKTRRLP